MQTLTVEVKQVDLKGPFKSSFKQKDGSSKESSYNMLVLKTEQGDFVKFQNDDDISVKIGDIVNLAYETKQTSKGTSNNIKKLEILENVQVSRTNTSSTIKIKETNTGSGGTGTLGSKDISMEVSGLLQALINSGTSLDALESKLRQVLNLKRKIAKELEENGSL